MVNKFLENKTEVMNKVKTYMKKYVKVTVQPSTSKSSKTEQLKVTTSKVWLEHYADLMKKLVIFLNENTISSDSFAKEVLQSNSDVLDEMIAKRDCLDKRTYGSFIVNINAFLFNKEWQNDLINKNKATKTMVYDLDEFTSEDTSDDDDDDDDDLPIYTGHVNNNKTQKKVTRSDSIISDKSDELDRFIARHSNNNNNFDEKDNRRRSTRSAIKPVKEVTINEEPSYPYDVSRVFIEGELI